MYVYVYIQVEGIPTLVVVTKEGKLLTDEGDEQVLNRAFADIYFYYLHLQIDIFAFAERYISKYICSSMETLNAFFQVTSLKPAEAVGAWKEMADKS